MSSLLHFVDNQNVFLRFREVPGKITCFISWFRLKIIVAGRYTRLSIHRFIYINFGSSQNLNKNSQNQVFCKKDVLRNFAKFIGKHLCHSHFFNKVAGLSTATLLKKRLWHRCFSVNFAKFLKTPFLTEHLRWLLLNNYYLSILTFSIFLSLIYLDQIIQVRG